MKRKRYSEEQTVSILNEREAGASAADLARKHGVAEQSIHRWKSKYGGMTVSDLKRLKRLEGENLRLKRMVADLSLNHADARGRHGNVKKVVTPAAKRKAAGGLRKAAGGLRKTHPASERRTCRLLGLHRSVARSRPETGRGDGPLADRLRELARRHPRYGYLTPPRMLKREGLVVNRKRKRRVYARLGLQVRAKRRRRLWRPRVPLAMPARPNGRWPAGFMSGQLVAASISGARLALFLDELGKAAAPPKAVVCDNGPELTSKAMRFWSERSGAALNFIQPGKPTQNAFVESCNGKFRDSCLNQHWFKGLADVRRIVDDWRHHYNHERPHSSLGYSTPAERAKKAA